MSNASVPRYSARVRLLLQVGDESLRVAKVGPASMYLRETRDLPPGTQATLIVSVDGKERHSLITLVEGASIDCPRVAFV